MSAPGQNESAKPTPPWATEELRRYAPRRHQAEGGATVSDSPSSSVPLPHHLIARQNAMLPHAVSDDFVDDEFRRGLWSSKLDPVVMPLPPEDPDRPSRLRSLIKIGAAIGIAASVAMIVVNMTSFEDGGQAESGRAQIMPTAVLESLAQIDPAEAKVAQEDPPPSTATIMAAATTDIGTRASPSPSSLSLAPSPMSATAASNPPPAPQAAPQRPTVPLPRDEVDTLMKRGRDLLTAGDVASARLILTRLSDAGNAEASLLLARTYDPVELARSRLVGAVPDLAKARTWYLKAAEQGSAEASRRIQQSAAR